MKDLSELRKRENKLVIFDARGKQSYDQLHIAGALLPLSQEYYEKQEQFRKGLIKSLPDKDKDLASSVIKYPKSTPMVTYCNDNCQASAVLLLQLKHLGFTDVRALDDGVQNWKKAGYPAEGSDVG